MFRRFLFDQRGNLSVTLTLAMVPLMAAVAGAVDVSGTLNDAERLQNALDATAFAVATAYDAEMTDAELIAVAKNHFVGNLETLQYDASVFGKLASGPNPTGDGVRVTTSVSGITEVRVQANIKHEGFLGANYWKPFRKSIVQTQEGSITCFLALDKYASAAIDIQGSTDIELHKCVMAANSNSTSAIYRNGSAQLDAQCAYAVGETSGLVNSSSVNLECGDPLEHRLPVIDTLASVPLPADTVCQTVPNRKTKTLVPGTYCGDRISGEVTLDPGTYVLNGGSVDLGGNGYLVGYGVTIFLRNNAKFTINGNEGVVLTPPNSGPYAGITIYQERANTNAVKINGTSGSTIDGFVYAPGAQVTYNGNAGASTLGKCLRVVGDTIVLTGNSTVKSDCTAELGDREVSSGRATALVE